MDNQDNKNITDPNLNEPVPPVQQYGAPQQVPAPPKDGKKKTVYITIAIIVFVAVCVGAYFVVSSRLAAGNEETAYEILTDNDNPEDYEDYLAKFPDGEHADEVRQRLAQLKEMIAQWNSIQLSDNVNDFIDFKSRYTDAQYGRLCDIKIDSLDFVKAQRDGSAEAFQRYLEVHPDGRYASEASIAQGQIQDSQVTTEDRDQIMGVLTDFFRGFQNQDETLICSNIASVMTRFLHASNVTKANVVSTINGMFNEHIQSCQFVVNRDITIQRVPGKGGNAASYRATFTVDQHIQRDNEGKTFGSYKCVAEISDQLLITSLTMDELSKQ